MGIVVDNNGQPSSATFILDIEFRPGFPGRFHLSPQKEPLVQLQIFCAPKIYYIIDSQSGLTSPAAGGSYAK
jgi:hypothetical protein